MFSPRGPYPRVKIGVAGFALLMWIAVAVCVQGFHHHDLGDPGEHQCQLCALVLVVVLPLIVALQMPLVAFAETRFADTVFFPSGTLYHRERPRSPPSHR